VWVDSEWSYRTHGMGERELVFTATAMCGGLPTRHVGREASSAKVSEPGIKCFGQTDGA
jgi:hypothetical protein